MRGNSFSVGQRRHAAVGGWGSFVVCLAFTMVRKHSFSYVFVADQGGHQPLT